MPYRDPNNYQIGFLISAVLLGMWGGVVRIYRRLRNQEARYSWRRSAGELLLSMTAAFLAGLLCHHFQVDKPVNPNSQQFFIFQYPITCLCMWLASNMGMKLFDLLDELYAAVRIELLNRVHGESSSKEEGQ